MPRPASRMGRTIEVAAYIFGAGLLSVAVTLGIYIRMIQTHDDDIRELKRSQDIGAVKERVSVLEALFANRANAPLIVAPPSTRPTAGRQR